MPKGDSLFEEVQQIVEERRRRAVLPPSPKIKVPALPPRPDGRVPFSYTPPARITRTFALDLPPRRGSREGIHEEVQRIISERRPQQPAEIKTPEFKWDEVLRGIARGIPFGSQILSSVADIASRLPDFVVRNREQLAQANQRLTNAWNTGARIFSMAPPFQGLTIAGEGWKKAVELVGDSPDVGQAVSRLMGKDVPFDTEENQEGFRKWMLRHLGREDILPGVEFPGESALAPAITLLAQIGYLGKSALSRFIIENPNIADPIVDFMNDPKSGWPDAEEFFRAGLRGYAPFLPDLVGMVGKTAEEKQEEFERYEQQFEANRQGRQVTRQLLQEIRETRGEAAYQEALEQITRLGGTEELWLDDEGNPRGKLPAFLMIADTLVDEQDFWARQEKYDDILGYNMQPLNEMVQEVLVDPLNWVGLFWGKFANAARVGRMVRATPLPASLSNLDELVNAFDIAKPVAGRATGISIWGRPTRGSIATHVERTFTSTLGRASAARGARTADDVLETLRILKESPDDIAQLYRTGYITEDIATAKAVADKLDLEAVAVRAQALADADKAGRAGKYADIVYLDRALQEAAERTSREAFKVGAVPDLPGPLGSIEQRLRPIYQRVLRPFASYGYLTRFAYPIQNFMTNVTNLGLNGIAGLRNVIPSNRMAWIFERLGYQPSWIKQGFTAVEGIKHGIPFSPVNIAQSTALWGEGGQRFAGGINAFEKLHLGYWKPGVGFYVPDWLKASLSPAQYRRVVRGLSSGWGGATGEEFHRVFDNMALRGLDVDDVAMARGVQLRWDIRDDLHRLTNDLAVGRIDESAFRLKAQEIVDRMDDFRAGAKKAAARPAGLQEPWFEDMMKEALDEVEGQQALGRVEQAWRDYFDARTYLNSLEVRQGKLPARVDRLLREFDRGGLEFKYQHEHWFRDSSVYPPGGLPEQYIPKDLAPIEGKIPRLLPEEQVRRLRTRLDDVNQRIIKMRDKTSPLFDPSAAAELDNEIAQKISNVLLDHEVAARWLQEGRIPFQPGIGRKQMIINAQKAGYIDRGAVNRIMNQWWGGIRRRQVPAIRKLLDELSDALGKPIDEIVREGRESSTLIKGGALDIDDIAAPDMFAHKAVVQDLVDRVATGEHLLEGGIDPAVLRRAKDWVDNDLMLDWREFVRRAEPEAKMWVDDALFDYTRRYQGDTLLAMGVPFHIWATRSMKFYALQLARNPAYFSTYMKLRRMNENMNRDPLIPGRVKRNFNMTELFDVRGPNGEDVYWDPISLMFPFLQVAPFSNMHYRDYADEQDAVTGWTWAQQIQELAGLQPWFFLQIPFKLATGTPRDRLDQWYLTQLTAGIKAGTSVFKSFFPELAGWIPEGGVNLEAGKWLRTPDGEVLGGPNLRSGLGALDSPLSEERYWPMMHLAYMHQEGAITEDEMFDAAVSLLEGKPNPTALIAYQRGAYQRDVNVLSRFMTSTGINLVFPAETALRKLQQGLRERGYDPTQNPGGSLAEVNKMREDNPALAVRSAAFQLFEPDPNVALDQLQDSVFYRRSGQRMDSARADTNTNIRKEPWQRISELFSPLREAREEIGEYPASERSLVVASFYSSPDEYKTRVHGIIMGELYDDIAEFLGDAEGEERDALLAQYWGQAKTRPWIQELAQRTYGEARGNERKKRLGEDGFDLVQSVYPRLLTGDADYLSGFIASQVSERDYEIYLRRNDTPLMAAVRAYNEEIYADAWNDYRALRDEGARSWTAARQTLRATGELRGTQLIPLIMQLYPGRWTRDQLTRELSGIVFPSPFDTWKLRRESDPQSRQGGVDDDRGYFGLREELRDAIDEHDLARERAGFPIEAFDVSAAWYSLNKVEKQALISLYPWIDEYIEWEGRYREANPTYREALKAMQAGERIADIVAQAEALAGATAEVREPAGERGRGRGRAAPPAARISLETLGTEGEALRPWLQFMGTQPPPELISSLANAWWSGGEISEADRQLLTAIYGLMEPGIAFDEWLAGLKKSWLSGGRFLAFRIPPRRGPGGGQFIEGPPRTRYQR